MAKMWRLFICVLFSFIQISIYNSVFAGCHVEHKYDEEQGMVVDIQVCDEPEPWDQGGETPELCSDWCCWIKLNTNFPIIWDCISIGSDSKTNVTNAFPYMVWAITKIVMSLIMVVCFILVIYAGILWSSDHPKEAKDILEKVAKTILLLWFSGVILKLINPNFFG